MRLLQSEKFKFNSVKTCEGSESLACLLAHKLAITATQTQAEKTAPWSETKDSWLLSAVTLARGSSCPSLTGSHRARDEGQGCMMLSPGGETRGQETPVLSWAAS